MKTNFISNLKQVLFLVIAVFGTLVSYGQATQNPSIGGSKTPSTDPFGQILDIGGTQGTPRDTTGGMIVLSSYTKTNCIFASSVEIGGGGKGTGTTDTGQFDDDDFDPYDIGGKSSSGGLGFLDVDDIGGRNSGGRGTSTGGDFDSDPSDIGGRGGHTGTGTGELAIMSLEYIPGQGCIFDTGGRDSATDLSHNPIGGKNSDTGLITFADTGGRNGTGTSTTTGDHSDDYHGDTGGRGGRSTTGEVVAVVPLPFITVQ